MKNYSERAKIEKSPPAKQRFQEYGGQGAMFEVKGNKVGCFRVEKNTPFRYET